EPPRRCARASPWSRSDYAAPFGFDPAAVGPGADSVGPGRHGWRACPARAPMEARRATGHKEARAPEQAPAIRCNSQPYADHPASLRLPNGETKAFLHPGTLQMSTTSLMLVIGCRLLQSWPPNEMS